MPVYPCAKCNSPVDPTTDGSCKNCREAKPLQCSRCNKRIGTEEVFGREKLRTKKPIFCLECGDREEVVKCGLCNLSLQRHAGKQIQAFVGAPVYHRDCLANREKQLQSINRSAPVLLLAGFLLGGVAGYYQASWVGAAVGAGVLALIGGSLAKLLIARWTPS